MKKKKKFNIKDFFAKFSSVGDIIGTIKTVWPYIALGVSFIGHGLGCNMLNTSEKDCKIYKHQRDSLVSVCRKFQKPKTHDDYR